MASPLQEPEVRPTAAIPRRAVEVTTLFADTILQVCHLVPDRRGSPRFTIGPSPEATFHLPGEGLPGGCFPLVRARGDFFELLLPPAITGEVSIGGRTLALQELAGLGFAQPAADDPWLLAVPLLAETRARLDLGAVRFVVSTVAAPRRYPVPVRVERQLLSTLAGVAAAGALFLTLAFSVPPDARALSLDPTTVGARFGRFIIKPPEEKAIAVQAPELVKQRGGGAGRRHQGAEGAAGSPKARPVRGRFALPGPRDNPDPQLARRLAEERVKSAGVLGFLRAVEGSPMASIFGRDRALGSDAVEALGGLVGTQVADAYGCPGCLGVLGDRRGGGGTGPATIGVGDLGRLGPGGGPGPGGPGPAARLAKKRDFIPEGSSVVTVHGDALSRDIVRRVVRSHLNEVRFCYERELARQPDLYGRVMVQFTVASLGQVVASQVQQSTLAQPRVEQCISDAVKRWQFPRPESGGFVQVSYPFLLRSAGTGE